MYPRPRKLRLSVQNADEWPVLNGRLDPKEFIFGIEIEVERFYLEQCPYRAIPYWQIKHDGSLRNYGAELVSVPLRRSELSNALDTCYDLLEIMIETTGYVPDFSWRTSTHVHVNVRELDTHQLFIFALLEMLYSRTLFSFVGKNRQRSNFCVPNCIKHDTKEFLANLPYITGGFGRRTGTAKYSSLNFNPILSFGTVEFRQFHGANDPVKLTQWIDIIRMMYEYVTQVGLKGPRLDMFIQELLSLNNSDVIVQFSKKLFGDELFGTLAWESGVSFVDQVKQGLFNAKECLLRYSPAGSIDYNFFHHHNKFVRKGL